MKTSLEYKLKLIYHLFLYHFIPLPKKLKLLNEDFRNEYDIDYDFVVKNYPTIYNYSDVQKTFLKYTCDFRDAEHVNLYGDTFLIKRHFTRNDGQIDLHLAFFTWEECYNYLKRDYLIKTKREKIINKLICVI
jgi:hypothetical protein